MNEANSVHEDGSRKDVLIVDLRDGLSTCSMARLMTEDSVRDSDPYRRKGKKQNSKSRKGELKIKIGESFCYRWDMELKVGADLREAGEALWLVALVVRQRLTCQQ